VIIIPAVVVVSVLVGTPPVQEGPKPAPASVPAPAAAASPAPAMPPPAAVPAKKSNYLKLAAPAFSGVNVDEKVASFFAEHFAGALVRHGVLVLTSSELNAMLGLERSKQLAGCTEEAMSCLTELSNALGVDGLVAGTVAKFGGTLQANIKVFSANTGTALKAISVKAAGEEAFLEALSQQAAAVAPDLLQRVGREAAPTLEVEAKVVRANIVTAGAIPALASVFLARIGQWYSLEYERLLADWVGIYAAPMVLTYDIAQDTFLPKGDPAPAGRAPYHASLLRLEMGGRFYWPGRAPNGWWAAPSVGVGAGDVGIAIRDVDGGAVTTETRSGLDFSAGLSVGYQWYPYEMIPVIVGLGFEWHSSELASLPIGRLHVGFAW